MNESRTSAPGNPAVTTPAHGESAADTCPVRRVLTILGDAWSHGVVYELADGPLRFSELQRMLTSISKKVLAQTLARLERDGLVSRAEAPGRVTYALTPLGERFLEPVRMVASWARANEPLVTDVLQRRSANSSDTARPRE